MLKILNIFLIQFLFSVIANITQLDFTFNHSKSNEKVVSRIEKHRLSDLTDSVLLDTEDDQNSLKNLSIELTQYYHLAKIKLFYSENKGNSYFMRIAGLLQLDIPPPFIG